MSYAVQCLQESIIAMGGYVDEIEICKKINFNRSYIFEAFNDLILHKLLSEEYFENKGHKVLGRFIENTNAFEINPDVKNDEYEESYLLTYTKTVLIESEGKEHSFKAKDEIFVGSYKGAKEHAIETKKILLFDKDVLEVTYSLRKNEMDYK